MRTFATTFDSSSTRVTAALLTPQNWLVTKYGESLKQFLLDEFDVKALVQFDPAGEQLFETAQTTALIVFLEAKECT